MSFFFFQAEDGIRDKLVTGVQTCALPILRKDIHVEKKGWLYDVRAAVALMTNAALAREGVEAAVSARSLAARGLARKPAVYSQATRMETMAYRAELQESGVLAHEQLATYAGWQAQAL